MELRLGCPDSRGEPRPAHGAILQDSGADAALPLTLERGKWRVELLGKFGGGVLEHAAAAG